MPPKILSRRALNRALLDRQKLLRPAALPVGRGRAARVIAMVEHLVGLQAQAPNPPYCGLWSRLEGFRPGDLAELILDRRVVRVALMRGTIHLVSARDCLAFRPLTQPVLDRALRVAFGKQLDGVDLAALAEAGRAVVEEAPRTFSELGGLLSARWPGHSPSALAMGVRMLVPGPAAGRVGRERAGPAHLGRNLAWAFAGRPPLAGAHGDPLPGRVRAGQRRRRADVSSSTASLPGCGGSRGPGGPRR